MYLHRGLAELHPQFDECPGVCGETGRARDEGGPCGECPVRELEAGFEEETRQELEEECGEALRRWSFETLYFDVQTAMVAARRVKRGTYPRGCTALEARLIDIVRAEQSRAERIDLWERRQAMKRRSKNNE
ncbi:MAG TPA: hypothetical protein VGX48_25305 [Pyrinomonadaceae bacterium]|nr:hypothetical protein [Pyrinomonadaceae bacterium]